MQVSNKQPHEWFIQPNRLRTAALDDIIVTSHLKVRLTPILLHR